MLYLADNEIHLWSVTEDIFSVELLEQYRALLIPDELFRYQRFIYEADQQQYLVTRALVRYVLSLYAPNVQPEHWLFSVNDYGKPEIHVDLHHLLPFPLRFNLSHTVGNIVLAVTNGLDVGIDVESLSRSLASKKIAKHSFSVIENEQLALLPDIDFKQRFLELWTLKEAYIKACGLGLSIPLKDFSFKLTDGKIKFLLHDKHSELHEDGRFVFRQFQEWDKPKNTMSLAIRAEKENVDYQLHLFSTVPLLKFEEKRLRIKYHSASTDFIDF